MNEYTENSRLAITNVLTPEVILAAICSLASQFVSQNSEAIANASESIMQVYRVLDTNRSIKEMRNNTHTSFFDKNAAIDSSLSPIDKAVYHVLLVLADNEAHQCSPKVQIIAKKASCSESAVRKSLATLEKHSLIRRQFRYINHRQISSLYTLIMPEPSSGEQVAETGTQSNIPLAETENNSTIRKVSNSTEHKPTYFIGDTKKRASLHQKEGDDTLHQKEGEKILKESFKESLREGGASLPAKAEKDLDEPDTIIPKEVTPTEETKASLTGGALLPILGDERTETPEAPENIASTSSKTEETPFIRAESDGTTMTDNAVTTLQENTLVRPETTLDAPMANVAPTTGETPASELSKALLREYEQLRAEYTRDEKPTVETKSVASLLDDVLADIVIKADSREVATPEIRVCQVNCVRDFS